MIACSKQRKALEYQVKPTLQIVDSDKRFIRETERGNGWTLQKWQRTHPRLGFKLRTPLTLNCIKTISKLAQSDRYYQWEKPNMIIKAFLIFMTLKRRRIEEFVRLLMLKGALSSGKVYNISIIPVKYNALFYSAILTIPVCYLAAFMSSNLWKKFGKKVHFFSQVNFCEVNMLTFRAILKRYEFAACCL